MHAVVTLAPAGFTPNLYGCFLLCRLCLNDAYLLVLFIYIPLHKIWLILWSELNHLAHCPSSWDIGLLLGTFPPLKIVSKWCILTCTAPPPGALGFYWGSWTFPPLQIVSKWCILTCSTHIQQFLRDLVSSPAGK